MALQNVPIHATIIQKRGRQGGTETTLAVLYCPSLSSPSCLKEQQQQQTGKDGAGHSIGRSCSEVYRTQMRFTKNGESTTPWPR